MAESAVTVIGTLTSEPELRYDQGGRAQLSLRTRMMVLGGWYRSLGHDERYFQRSFYLLFGVDVLTAQTLNEDEAEQLEMRIVTELLKNNVSPVPASEAA